MRMMKLPQILEHLLESMKLRVGLHQVRNVNLNWGEPEKKRNVWEICGDKYC